MPGRSSNKGHAAPTTSASLRIALPSGAHCFRFLLAALTVSLVFLVVYVGCDYLTGLRETRLRVDFRFERSLPFLPELSLIYSSLYVLFVSLVLILDSEEIWQLATVMILTTLVAGFCFLVLPAEIAFVRPDRLGTFPAVFQLSDAINLTYNLCPSLHVTYAVTCAETVRRKRPRLGWLFHVWALAIAFAAWLTYQHHLLDLLAGYALALAAVEGVRYVSRRDPPQPDSTP
jgi:membrane-associated phospholipid phosphatase